MSSKVKFKLTTPGPAFCPAQDVTLSSAVGDKAIDMVGAFAAFMFAVGFSQQTILDAMEEYLEQYEDTSDVVALTQEGEAYLDSLAKPTAAAEDGRQRVNICLPRDLTPEETDALDRAAEVAAKVAGHE